MIMARALLLFTAVASAAAAPAIVWKAGSTFPQHSSESITASSLLKSAFDDASHDALAVVFIVGRDKDGSESLGRLASSGQLPETEARYGSAHSIHHHVYGMESGAAAAQHARDGAKDTMEMSLSEFNSLLTSSQKLAEDVVVVTVERGDSPSALDAAVSGAVDRPAIGSVVLAAQRSAEEVKNERALARRRNKVIKRKREVLTPGRRRLEDQQNDDANNQNQDDEYEVAYYVSMTPNILAGVMFTFFFIFVSHLGLHCMGLISNSDVFATKLPSVGREV